MPIDNVHSFSTHLLNAYYTPSTVLGNVDSKTKTVPTEKGGKIIVFSVSCAISRIYKGSCRSQEEGHLTQTGGINDGFLEEMTHEKDVKE